MDTAIRNFLQKNRSAAMITLRRDGTPHVVRVGVALVDGKLWSSGTSSRVRTKHLRRDPRSTLFVFDSEFRYLGLECTVTILDGPDAPDLNMRFFELIQQDMTPPPSPGTFNWFGRTKTAEEFRRSMLDEGRLIYEFEVKRAYGMYG